jgi:hypothetical protein
MQYKIYKKNKDAKEVIIEKSGITAQFTINDIEKHEMYLEKSLKEVEGKLQIEEARSTNILNNNVFLMKLSEEELNAAHLYFESMAFIATAKPKIKEIKDQIKSYKKEKEEIIKQTQLDVK